MQLPEHSGHRWVVAGQLMVILSLVFSSTLLATGLYQVAVGTLRSAGQPNGADLALRLLHVLAGAAGLAAFSSLLRSCQACKLWLGLALSMASLVACAFLALRLVARGSVDGGDAPAAFGADHVTLIVAASASFALCLVQSAALYLLQTAREATARQPRRYQVPPTPPPPPPMTTNTTSRRWPQQQRMAELWRRFDGPQHLPPPMALAGASPPPPPPPYPELPAKPPPYTQSRV